MEFLRESRSPWPSAENRPGRCKVHQLRRFSHLLIACVRHLCCGMRLPLSTSNDIEGGWRLQVQGLGMSLLLGLLVAPILKDYPRTWDTK